MSFSAHLPFPKEINLMSGETLSVTYEITGHLEERIVDGEEDGELLTIQTFVIDQAKVVKAEKVLE